MKNTIFSSSDVDAVAARAQIPLTDTEKGALATGFTTVLAVLDTLKQANVAGVEPTSQVTGLENVTREDVIDTARMFSQDEALANSQRKQNGYVVVDQILD